MVISENQIINNVEFIDIADEGQAVAKIDNRVIFARGAVPGDIATIKIIKKKRRFFIAQVVEVTTPSFKRANVPCTHFNVCGGCKWQNLQYQYQLEYKQKTVSDAFRHIGGISVGETLPILGSGEEYFYRNKLEFTFSNKRWLCDTDLGKFSPGDKELNGLGFHVPKFFDKVLDIEKCYLQPDPSNELRLAVKEYALEHKLDFFDLRAQTGLMRNMVVRNTSSGQLMVIIIFAYFNPEAINSLMEFLVARFPQITSAIYIVNNKKNDTYNDLEPVVFKGNPFIVEEMAGLKFQIGPKSFFQTNSRQTNVLYNVVKDFAGLNGSQLVYDLYTGTGTIALYLAGKAKKVVGVEFVQEAVDDAKVNAILNGIDNTVFFAGDMKDILTIDFASEHGNPDVVVLDPPRAGVHPNVVGCLLNLLPPKIVYVSCNPATQARDIQMLLEKYKVVKIQPVDMFPHTQHVENVALLELL